MKMQPRILHYVQDDRVQGLAKAIFRADPRHGGQAFDSSAAADSLRMRTWRLVVFQVLRCGGRDLGERFRMTSGCLKIESIHTRRINLQTFCGKLQI